MNHYRRLMQPNVRLSPTDQKEREQLENALRALGKSMITVKNIPRELDPDPLGRDNNSLAFAGYTYFGQFIDHDLTHNETPLDKASQDVEQTPNLQFARLGLDQLYGGGPAGSPQLYDPDSPLNEKRFLLGRTLSGRLRDLPRNDKGEAMTGDSRHDENLILSQITVAFARFHNAVLKLAQTGTLKNVLPPGSTLFERVRRLVTWHYQYLVVYDFLPQILDLNTLKKLHRNGPCAPFITEEGKPFEVSVEFALAGFRYGHSAVRNSYQVNDAIPRSPDPNRAHDVLLEELLDPTVFLSAKPDANGQRDYRLRDEWVVDWRFFFELPGVEAADGIKSARLDTRIAATLHDLPLYPRDPNSPRLALPTRTLLRGARVGLPSGQEVAELLGEQKLTEKQILSGLINVNPNVVTGPGFDKDTPLFYYVLKEAEILGERRKLGPVGSRLVGETIFAALDADPFSYWNQAPGGKKWLPSLGTSSGFGMDDLLLQAGVADPTRA